jgi:hypothetical protein
MKGRELHEYIRVQIERRLGDRSWSWLAEQAGVARSTLASQRARPKFSIEVLVRVAGALNQELTALLPTASPEPEPTRDAVLDQIERCFRLLRDRD